MSEYASEIVKFNGSSKVEFVDFDFGSSTINKSQIKGITVQNEKTKSNDIAKELKSILASDNPSAKIARYLVPAKAKAGTKATHVYPVFCCATASDPTTDDLVKMPIKTVNDIMDYFGCKVTTDLVLDNYKSLPTVDMLTSKTSPIGDYKVDIRWYAHEIIKLDQEEKKKARKERSETKKPEGEEEPVVKKKKTKKPSSQEEEEAPSKKKKPKKEEQEEDVVMKEA